MNKILKIDNERQFRQTFLTLSKFREQSRYCDILLVVDGQEIPAHKCVLAAGSKYFDLKFKQSPSLPEPSKKGTVRPKKMDLKLKNKASYQTVLSIVNYLYTGVIEYSEEAVMDLIKTLDELGVECNSLLARLLNDRNCFEMLKIEGEFCSVSLKEAAKNHIVSNLNILYQKDGFKNLTKDEVEFIIATATEIDIDAFTIFKAVTSWIEKDRSHRTEHFEEFLDYISLDDLTPNQIKECVVLNDLFRSSGKSCRWLVKSITDQNFHLSMRILENSKMYVFSRGPRRKMFTMRPTPNYDMYTGSRYEAIEWERPALDSFSMTRYKDIIYAVGGKRHNQIVNIGLKFDTVQKTWTEFLCPIGKMGCGVCTSKPGKMLVVGGVIGNTCQKTCSSYDFETGQWSPLPNMEKARWNPGVAVLHSSVFTFGGIAHGEEHPIVERYDPREGTWYSAGMLSFYAGTVATRLGANIYCLKIGSEDIYRYDARTLGFMRLPNDDGLRGEWIAPYEGTLQVLHKEGIEHFDLDENDWRHSCDGSFDAYSILVV
ncbi:unnamed protein product [Hermetia illucens]|uniref:BTB domain-containing protein n=1 Tax=Hermetia illucens TaxID=343691 RepID=A0A7R8UI82_HERIL|nr:kelch-like protein 1 [Hermetia illucens]CAD7081083.1 unnamed protein product [Hermetia illucens]